MPITLHPRFGIVLFILFTGVPLALAQTPALNPATVRTKALLSLSPIPDKIPGAEKDTVALVSLGKELYFDKRLSKNGTQSCNTCHAIDDGRAGVDNEPTSVGAFGKRGDRNSPTVFNAALHMAQFWDGRASDLEEQAKGPILNPVEMAMTSPQEVIERLKAETNYPPQFEAAFSGETNSINYENVVTAIAAFERTLITHDRLDNFLKGRDDALTPVELSGLSIFITTGCTACHNGPLLGGNSYQKSGLLTPYVNQGDVGRYDVTKDEEDRFKFKVPSLRNIAVTHPYFHDGRIRSLPEAIRTMATIQLGKEFTQEEAGDLIAFLKALIGNELHRVVK